MTQELQPASGVLIRPGWWTKPRTLAAQLIAEGELTQEEICSRISKSHTWLVEFKRLDHVQERVAEIRQAIADEVMQYGIAVKANRIAGLQKLHDEVREVIEGRAHPGRRAASERAGRDAPGLPAARSEARVKELEAELGMIYAGRDSLLDERDADKARVKALEQEMEAYVRHHEDTARLRDTLNSLQSALTASEQKRREAEEKLDKRAARYEQALEDVHERIESAIWNLEQCGQEQCNDVTRCWDKLIQVRELIAALESTPEKGGA